MAEIHDTPAIILLAFDLNGVYFGSAELMETGKWSCWTRGMQQRQEFGSETEAEQFLRSNGAATIQRDGGMKA